MFEVLLRKEEEVMLGTNSSDAALRFGTVQQVTAVEWPIAEAG